MSSTIFTDKIARRRILATAKQEPLKAELGEGDTPIPYEYLPRDYFKVFPRGCIVGDPAPTPKPAEAATTEAKRVRMRDWKQQ